MGGYSREAEWLGAHRRGGAIGGCLDWDADDALTALGMSNSAVSKTKTSCGAKIVQFPLGKVRYVTVNLRVSQRIHT